MLNQTALVLSFKPLRNFYDGVKMYTQNGYVVYMFVIPYTPSKVIKNYRLLATRTDLSYQKIISSIVTAWEKYNIIFDRRLTALSEPIRGITNVGFTVLNPTLEEHIKIEEKTLADTTTTINDLQEDTK